MLFNLIPERVGPDRNVQTIARFAAQHPRPLHTCITDMHNALFFMFYFNEFIVIDSVVEILFLQKSEFTMMFACIGLVYVVRVHVCQFIKLIKSSRKQFFARASHVHMGFDNERRFWLVSEAEMRENFNKLINYPITNINKRVSSSVFDKL